MATLIADKFAAWEKECQDRFDQLKANEEELNKIFIELYGLQDELDYHVPDEEITVSLADRERDIKSLISYAVGCMFGRYSLDVEGLAYAGGGYDRRKYTTFVPTESNIILIPDDDYFGDDPCDIMNRFTEFIKTAYGPETLEENLQYVADSLKGTGTSHAVVRNYFVKSFYKDHLKTYKKRPIYWQFDSGRNNGVKALMYLHRYESTLLYRFQDDCLKNLMHVYDDRWNMRTMQIQGTKVKSDIKRWNKEKEKLKKQMKELDEYIPKVKRLAALKIELDLDDGVVVNYDKLQTNEAGKLTKILARR